MISEQELDKYRMDGTLLRVIRDADIGNDVKGYLVAWDEKSVLIRKANRKVVQLSREYTFQPFEMERPRN
ncbi:hypothetical protein [Ferviditalea candida]|uniref:Uncharacterized protein n=1 Tax=Ferviditalea candida TaxID=3108399 RepID=A0ABU5ZES2_9BACL|nr:hypothetical protein [Paenibacillaceae bacterium T2]